MRRKKNLKKKREREREKRNRGKSVLLKVAGFISMNFTLQWEG